MNPEHTDLYVLIYFGCPVISPLHLLKCGTFFLAKVSAGHTAVIPTSMCLQNRPPTPYLHDTDLAETVAEQLKLMSGSFFSCKTKPTISWTQNFMADEPPYKRGNNHS